MESVLLMSHDGDLLGSATVATVADAQWGVTRWTVTVSVSPRALRTVTSEVPYREHA